MTDRYLVMRTDNGQVTLYSVCETASQAMRSKERAEGFKKYSNSTFLVISMSREHFEAIREFVLQEYCET